FWVIPETVPADSKHAGRGVKTGNRDPGPRSRDQDAAGSAPQLQDGTSGIRRRLDEEPDVETFPVGLNEIVQVGGRRVLIEIRSHPITPQPVRIVAFRNESTLFFAGFVGFVVFKAPNG